MNLSVFWLLMLTFCLAFWAGVFYLVTQAV